MTLQRFSAVIPAAGLSSRMGQFKPLLPLGCTTVIERVISLFSDLQAGQIVVVVGHAQERLIPLLRKSAVQIVENPDYREGMFTSITAGVRQVDPRSDAFFLLPADIPLVRSQTLESLAEAYGRHPGQVIHPVFQDERGHPPLIPAGLAAEIVQWRQEGGLKAFFESHDQLAVHLPVADRHTLFDIDTPEAYAELAARWEQYAEPTEVECEAILTTIHPVSDRTRRHGRKVAQVADRIGRLLNAVGLDLNLKLIRAGALLHDLAKGQKDHAERGGEMIARLGFPWLGRIVGAHTNLVPDPQGQIGETEVVFMADKLVRGDQLIPIAQRFQEPLERWADDPQAVGHILRRRQVAYVVKQQLETLLGSPLEEIVEHDRD